MAGLVGFESKNDKRESNEIVNIEEDSNVMEMAGTYTDTLTLTYESSLNKVIFIRNKMEVNVPC